MKNHLLLSFLQTNTLNDIRKKLSVVIIIIITLFQLVVFYKNNTFIVHKSKITNSETIQVTVGINEINEDLAKIKNIKINNQSKVGDRWKSFISFTGDSEMLIDSLNSFKLLKYYDVINYSIDGNSEYINLNMEIIR